ncbi:type II toxin-antitoxin system YafQ family toxin [Candidatus Pacebacteria bacterium]|nr:type II toxin-antitoxin system YafQ family toxin [Candidatus Paceibacterota bacterium]
MRAVIRQTKFKRDFKNSKRRGKDILKLQNIVQYLVTNGEAPPTSSPHKLGGKFSGLWECHIETDWLLIYDVSDTEVQLIRTGTHADLFE